MKKAEDDKVEGRRDDALRRALNTPPQPKKESAGRKEEKPKSKKPSD